MAKKDNYKAGHTQIKKYLGRHNLACLVTISIFFNFVSENWKLQI